MKGIQYPNQISDRLARMQTSNPPIGTGLPLEGLAGRLPISQDPKGKGMDGGGQWALSDWGRGGWSAIRIKENWSKSW